MSIILNNLTVSYQRHPAVHHISGRFAEGDATAIFGPNGAGKSTLLKTMIGALTPDSGHVDLNGHRRGDIAYLPQQAEIDRSMPVSVLELVGTGLWHRTGPFGKIPQAGIERALAALEQVGLADFALRPIAALSSGQFQRVLFARILVQDARVILLDEPFNAVDAKTTEDLLRLVARWREEKRTVIAVLHDAMQVKTHFPNTLLMAREVIAWGGTGAVLTDDNLLRAVETAAHWQAQAPVCGLDGARA
ncbi:metal ABC transporter ATP-binding protein [Chromobacterium sp. IIBBL 290-4]|uniref:metal ABC transporter ATP-binding protein n=1 Tax=Chromobacterium sp. IIBBL 290-4 TaxID=2953890 RepID=UPI0020B8DCE4|nr:ABC transporter ATP-binding protein [Chromobacterium sp. IIBBL 290-4]UTH72965.1 ABC transporter ATP-binding protein [Chromobacterium sp. IIBBL 290-4]